MCAYGRVLEYLLLDFLVLLDFCKYLFIDFSIRDLRVCSNYRCDFINKKLIHIESFYPCIFTQEYICTLSLMHFVFLYLFMIVQVSVLALGYMIESYYGAVH